MHKFNMSFVFHFYIRRLTSWFWTSFSTEGLKFKSPARWNSYEGFNLEQCVDCLEKRSSSGEVDGDAQQAERSLPVRHMVRRKGYESRNVKIVARCWETLLNEAASWCEFGSNALSQLQCRPCVCGCAPPFRSWRWEKRVQARKAWVASTCV